MVRTVSCINVFSDMNEWIDFCVIVNESDLVKAKKLIKEAYDNWWDDEDAYDYPIAEYIGEVLSDNRIEYQMYFSDEEEE